MTDLVRRPCRPGAASGTPSLTCDPVADKFCTVARDDPAAAPPGQVDKSAQQMVWIDVDADPTTFNSSSATLDLPPGAEVLPAQLVWGGTVQAGAGGRARTGPDPAPRTRAARRPAGGPVPVNAASVSLDPTAPPATWRPPTSPASWPAGGAGVYTVANLQIGTGSQRLRRAGRSRSSTGIPRRRCAWWRCPSRSSRSTAADAGVRRPAGPRAVDRGQGRCAGLRGRRGRLRHRPREPCRPTGLRSSNSGQRRRQPAQQLHHCSGRPRAGLRQQLRLRRGPVRDDRGAGRHRGRDRRRSSSDRFRIGASGLVVPL